MSISKKKKGEIKMPAEIKKTLKKVKFPSYIPLYSVQGDSQKAGGATQFTPAIGGRDSSFFPKKKGRGRLVPL